MSSAFVISTLFLLLGCSSCQRDAAATYSVSSLEGRVLGEPLPSNRNAALGIPQVLYRSMTGVFYLSREQYLIAWNPRTRNPDWSAWQLTASDIGTVGRTNKFLTDQDLASVSDAVRPDEYKGSCLDRGHVTPSGDRTDTSANNRITFYMSNMLPQTAFLNRMAWKHLEDYERQLASKYGEVFIYAGPLYDEGDEGAIGPHNDILIPTRMYKVMADAEGNVLAAVIMRNATSTGTSPVSDREQACIDSRSVHGDGDPEDWREYSVSVEDIEHHTGMQWTFLKKTKK